MATMKDLRTKSNSELAKMVNDLKAELFTLRFQSATGQLEKPHRMKLIRKEIARAKTIINDKQNIKANKEAK